MALRATLAAEGEARPGAAASSPRIIGHVYHVVSAAGLDGKNLRKCHPVSKTLRNDVPLHQSSVVTDNMNRNISRPGHSNLQDLFPNTPTSSFVKDTECKKTMSGKLILPKLFGQVEMIDASVIKENLTTPIISSIVKDNPTTPTIYSLPSNYCCTGISHFPNEPAMIGSETSNTSYALVNADRLPLASKSQVLPSKHPLQMPAHEEVTSVPVSLLLPSIQQNTLVTSISNGSEGCDIRKARTVIYVSPVNTVKPAAFKSLQNACPKSTTKVPESLPLTVPQTTVSSHALFGEAFDSKEKEESPIKWVVQGSPPSSASSCLVPVISPDNMAPQILKTLANVKTTDPNSACIVPAISNNPIVSQAEFPPMKDDTVVMFNKMYLLTKKESSITIENKRSKVILPRDEIHFGQHQSHLTASPAVNTITNQVVDLVLAKHKAVAHNPKDPKICEIIQLPLPSELNKSLKVAYTCSTSPHRNLKINNTSQHEATPVLGNTPLQMTADQKPVPRENTSQSLIQNIISQKPAATTLLPLTMPGAFREEEEKMEIIPEIQIKHRKVQDRQQYLQLRKKNSLLKEERVYLRRIPESVTSARPETTVSYSTVQTSDSSDFSQKTSIKSQLQEEEKIIEEPEEELNMKRKIKTTPICEHAKRKKTVVNLGVDQNDSFSAVDNPNSYTLAILEVDNSQASLQFSKEVDLDSNTQSTQIAEEIRTLSSASDCCENEPSHSEASFREDIFPFSPPDFEDTIRDEKITRLKRLLREQEAALEEISKNMQRTYHM